jgi:AmiR/NasT family two-component response regulator
LRPVTVTALSEYAALCARAQQARIEAQRQQDWAARLKSGSQAALGHALTGLTDNADWRPAISKTSAERLERLSHLIGRDPCIEQAKVVLRDRYQITGAQAFELLRHISQTRNRKLRDVARQVIAGTG